MITKIKYEVDKITLENAVRECIYDGLSPTKIGNIKNKIQTAVYHKGLNAINFPEIWYVDNECLNDYPQSKIDEIVSKLFGRIL
jgi:hypothetical protein